MDNFNPLVSIIIPVYNGANFMREAIDSALAQTYENIEVIVINDGSTDGGETDRIAKSYGDKIRYFSKPNGGVATALNLGIEKMNGEYFSWLSHDDVYLPDKVNNQVQMLEKTADKRAVVFGCFNIVNSKKEFLYRVDPGEKYNDTQLHSGIFMLLRGAINGCCLLIHRSLFDNVGKFNEALLTTQDYEMFFRLFKYKNNIIFCRSFDVLSRSHDDQGSKSMLDLHLRECCSLWINMIEAVSAKEMIMYEGSIYSFLQNTKKFLIENTLYVETIDFLERKIITQLLEDKISDEALFKPHLQDYLSLETLRETDRAALVKEICHLKKENNICFLLGDINHRGGLNKAVIHIANFLADIYNYNVVLIATNNNVAGYTVSDKVKFFRFDKRITENSVVLVKALLLLNIRVVVNSYNCNDKYLSLYEAAKKYGLKAVAWNHEDYFVPYYKKELYSATISRNARLANAEAAIWINKNSYKLYSAFNDNGVYLPNPLLIGNAKIKKKRTKRLIAAARFDDERKGLSELLKTFSIVAAKNKNVVLDIFGDYDLDLKAPRISGDLSYREYIAALRIPEDSIFFHGEVKNIEEQYQNSDLHIMTSYNEGFGLVILEAAACGVPTIAFGGSSAGDIIDNENNGFVINYGDTKKMAYKILSVLDLSDEKYFLLSSAALELAKKYSVEKIMRKWDLLIGDILTDKNRNADDYKQEGLIFDCDYDKNFIAAICGKYETAFSEAIRTQSNFTEDKLGEDKLQGTLKNNLRKTLKFYRKYGIKRTSQKIIEKLFQ